MLAVNAAAYYMRDTYTKRLPKLGALVKDNDVDLALVCESNTYADGRRLNKAFGWSGVMVGDGPKPSFVLHGPDVRITTAAHWRPGIELLAEGQFDTLPGSTHNGATYALNRCDGVLWLDLVTHLQYLPKGANTTRTKYDTERQQQLSTALSRAQVLAAEFAREYGVARVPVIVGEDFNGARTDAYDGPGAAMKTYGYRDVEQVASDRVPAAIIDRLGVSAGITVNRYRAISTNGATDHPHAVLVDLTITNE